MAPVAGEYKLECWGAQGGYGHIQTTGHGGKGGYAVGTIQINDDKKLYIVVGGKGDDMNCYRQFAAGGFNGGGKSMGNVNTAWGGGGGATSISYRSGTIADLSSYKNQIIIVAGGGGGGGHCYTDSSPNYYSPHAGGDGGGTTGGNGATDDNDGGAGATLTKGYEFGKGQDGKETQGEGSSFYYGSGGGGGYYGGYSGYTHGSAAGGGSGFLSPSIILSGTGSMTNGVREGNGEAVVAWFL